MIVYIISGTFGHVGNQRFFSEGFCFITDFWKILLVNPPKTATLKHIIRFYTDKFGQIRTKITKKSGKYDIFFRGGVFLFRGGFFSSVE